MSFFHEFAKWHMGLGLNDWGFGSYSKYEIRYVFGNCSCLGQFCDGDCIDMEVDAVLEKFRATQMRASLRGESVELIIKILNCSVLFGLSNINGKSSICVVISKMKS